MQLTNDKIGPVIAGLKNDARPYRESRSYAGKSGIYALFFNGNIFPLKDFAPGNDDLVYLGKSESTQVARDERTHFTTGKTGSSTLRRSLGALLRDELSLIPVPRNNDDFDAGRRSIYKFDSPSEERLTNWMKDNLAIAFHEAELPSAELALLESAVIAEMKPVLNIDSRNPGNQFAGVIRAARKICADFANRVAVNTEPQTAESASEPHQQKVVPFRSEREEMEKKGGPYKVIFETALPLIAKAIDEVSTRKLAIPLSQEDFKKAGSLKSCSFNLEFSSGTVANDAGGSPVARDLARVLLQDTETAAKMKERNLKFNLDKGFTLWVANK